MINIVCIDENSLRLTHTYLVSTHTSYVSTHKFVFQLTFVVSIYKTVWQFSVDIVVTKSVCEHPNSEHKVT